MASRAASSTVSKKFKNTFYEKRLTQEEIDQYEQQHQEQKVADVIGERQAAYETIDNLQIEIQQALHTNRPNKQ